MHDLVEPTNRVVVLGASNVIRGISVVVSSAELACGQPLDFLAACGHGRSYGMESWVLGRSLPGIIHCGLWEALRERPECPTCALVTDIGNDLLYGATVDQIVTWVETCLERLRPTLLRLVITRLPISSLAKLGPKRFLMMRTVLFPRSQLALDDAMQQAIELDSCLTNIAERYNAILVEPDEHWFGFDPIHVQFRHWNTSWKKIFQNFSDANLDTKNTHASFPLGIKLRMMRPLERKIFGVRQLKRQPVGRLTNGSLLSFF